MTSNVTLLEAISAVLLKCSFTVKKTAGISFETLDSTEVSRQSRSTQTHTHAQTRMRAHARTSLKSSQRNLALASEQLLLASHCLLTSHHISTVPYQFIPPPPPIRHRFVGLVVCKSTSFPSGFRTNKKLNMSVGPHAFYIPHPFHLPCVYHPNCIR